MVARVKFPDYKGKNKMNEVAKSTNCRMETERLDCDEGTNKG